MAVETVGSLISPGRLALKSFSSRRLMGCCWTSKIRSAITDISAIPIQFHSNILHLAYNYSKGGKSGLSDQPDAEHGQSLFLWHMAFETLLDSQLVD